MSRLSLLMYSLWSRCLGMNMMRERLPHSGIYDCAPPQRIATVRADAAAKKIFLTSSTVHYAVPENDSIAFFSSS